MQKLIRITTIPLSLEKLLEGQLTFMKDFYEVTAISAEKERLEQFGRDNQVKTYWVELTRAITPIKDIKAVIKLYRYLKKERPLIVHTHTPKAGIVGMIAAKLAGVPIRLHTVAGLPLLETSGFKRKVLNLVEKATYALATKIFPNSFGLEKIILNEGFASKNKIKVLGNGSSNGIDTHYFDPSLFSIEENLEIRTKLGIRPENLLFIFIGRLVSEKGINELIMAFNKLSDVRGDVSLLLVGPFEEELDPISEKSKTVIKSNPEIYSVGFQKDVRPYLSISDILVFPSYREGFPNVVLQAGAMGIPSIVSNINGCNEIISDRVNGIIVRAKDEKNLFQAMVELTNDSSLRDILGKNSRKMVCGKYEREEFWKILHNEYDLQVLNTVESKN